MDLGAVIAGGVASVALNGMVRQVAEKLPIPAETTAKVIPVAKVAGAAAVATKTKNRNLRYAAIGFGAVSGVEAAQQFFPQIATINGFTNSLFDAVQVGTVVRLPLPQPSPATVLEGTELVGSSAGRALAEPAVR